MKKSNGKSIIGQIKLKKRKMASAQKFSAQISSLTKTGSKFVSLRGLVGIICGFFSIFWKALLTVVCGGLSIGIWNALWSIRNLDALTNRDREKVPIVQILQHCRSHRVKEMIMHLVFDLQSHPMRYRSRQNCARTARFSSNWLPNLQNIEKDKNVKIRSCRSFEVKNLLKQTLFFLTIHPQNLDLAKLFN